MTIDISKKSILEQKEIIDRLIIEYGDIPIALERELSNIKLKPAVLGDFVREQNKRMSGDLLRVLDNKRIHEELRPPKIDRSVEHYADKTIGSNPGRFVKKSVLEGDDSSKRKYNSVWLEKYNSHKNIESAIEDVFREYIGSNLAREL